MLLSLTCLRKRGEQVLQVQRGWCGAFRHPERRKTSYVSFPSPLPVIPAFKLCVGGFSRLVFPCSSLEKMVK